MAALRRAEAALEAELGLVLLLVVSVTISGSLTAGWPGILARESMFRVEGWVGVAGSLRPPPPLLNCCLC